MPCCCADTRPPTAASHPAARHPPAIAHLRCVIVIIFFSLGHISWAGPIMHESVTRSRVSKTLVLVVTLLAAVAWDTRAQPPAQAPPELTFSPFHENGIYAVGEVAGWTVISSPAAAASSTTYTYTAKKNNQDVIKTGTIDLSASRATIEVSMNEPGMLYVQITREGGSPMTVGAAIEPRKILPAVPRPADFDQFWADKLAALAGVPIDPVLTPIETNVPGVDTYTVELASLGSHVHGYLSRPNREGRFPALVIYQYAGVYALNTKTVTDRAAEGWLAFDVGSHDMPPNAAEGVDRNYRSLGATSRETSLFLDMYLRDARAIDSSGRGRTGMAGRLW